MVEQPAEGSGLRTLDAVSGADPAGQEADVPDTGQRFRSTFHNAAVGMVHVAFDGTFIEVNERFCEIVDRPADAFAGLTFADITHPDDLAEDLGYAMDVRDGRRPSYQMDKRYLRPDGSTVWVRLTVSLIRDADGNPEAFSAVVEDIDDRKRAEARARTSQAFTRRVLDTLFMFVGILTPDGTLIEANRAPLAAAGLEPGDVLGRKFWDCYWWDYSPHVQERLRLAVERAAAGESIRYDALVRTSHEGRLWIDFQITPLRDDDGVITHLVPSGMDVSDRKAYELALREREAVQRRERARAELLADVVGEVERGADFAERTRRLVDMLVPKVADTATVEVRGESTRVLARAGDVPGGPVGDRLEVPLAISGDDATGLLVVSREAGRQSFSSDDALFVQAVADRAAVLLSRARLRDREHQIAVRLQRALMPERLAEVPGITLAARYEPATTYLEVGGDFYDSHLLPDGTLGIGVGDVVGHGLESAATMGRIRTAMSALAPAAAGPAALLTDLDSFSRGPDGTEFATASYLVLDPATRRLRYSTAGHPPPLVVGPGNTARLLTGGRSLPLAIGPLRERPEAEDELPEGARLVLYSDGLIERRGEVITAGLDRLVQTARRLGPLPPKQLCEELTAAMTTRNYGDDVVVLVAG